MATGQATDIRTEPPRRDYRSHKRQFDRFLHLTKWFIIHAALLLPALYFYVVAGEGIAGTAFLLLGLIALAYGVLTTGGIGRDVEAAIDSTGHPGRARR
jgi:hypothetical protein